MYYDPLQGPPYLLNPHTIDFPDANLALTEPDGLLAVGGDLRPDRLLNAYRHGIFPWYGDDQPILWWSPNPRTVLYPDQLYISRSLRKTMRKGGFTVTFDQCFAEVIRQCAAPRRDANETWITDEIQLAYRELHHRGYAHSIECWQNGELVGGLYGVAIGKVFFGESMFSRVSDASKVAFATLVQHLIQWDYQLIDCQVHTKHLGSLGASEIPRQAFLDQLQQLCPQPPAEQAWQQ